MVEPRFADTARRFVGGRISNSRWPRGTLILLVLAAQACAPDPAEVEAWLRDYEHLLDELATGYANLTSVAEERKLDLPTIAAESRERIRRARSARRARHAVRDLLERFRDPHLRSERLQRRTKPPSEGRELPRITAETDADVVLDLLEHRHEESDWEVRFDRLPGFEGIAESPFPAGLIELESGERAGILRIARFRDDTYGGEAEAYWAEFRSGLAAACDASCLERFIAAFRQHLTDELQDLRDRLVGSGATLLVVDVSGNGGGSEWAGEVARALAGAPLSPLEGGFVRRPHWTAQLQRLRDRVDEDLGRRDLPPSLVRALRESREGISALIEESERDCGAESIWDGEEPTCASVVRDGRLRRIDPSAFAADVVVSLSSYPDLFSRPIAPAEGRMDVPLFVVIDEGTASAAEWFASLLQANGAAILIGGTTYGAGCGYTNGGVQIELPALSLLVRMPDCVRYRADGKNELFGIVPDVPVWSGDTSGRARAAAVVDALSRLRP